MRRSLEAKLPRIGYVEELRFSSSLAECELNGELLLDSGIALPPIRPVVIHAAPAQHSEAFATESAPIFSITRDRCNSMLR